MAPKGFREYDARWLFGPQIRLLGIQILAESLASEETMQSVRKAIVLELARYPELGDCA